MKSRRNEVEKRKEGNKKNGMTVLDNGSIGSDDKSVEEKWQVKPEKIKLAKRTKERKEVKQGNTKN